jgi:hypothetical protein
MAFDLKEFLGGIAPTVALALGGPLAGAAVSAISGALAMPSGATANDIATVIAGGLVTPEQMAEVKKLEIQFQNDEAERGFKYAELVFKDRDSARNANVAGGVQKHLFWMSIVLLCITLGTEIYVLFHGYPTGLSDIIVGRVLGLMDAVAMMVLAYWYGTTNGSAQKTAIISQSEPLK